MGEGVAAQLILTVKVFGLNLALHFPTDVHTSFLAALNGAYGKVTSADEIMAELNKHS